jgi:hypothetical protein
MQNLVAMLNQNTDGTYEIFNEMNRLAADMQEKFGFDNRTANKFALAAMVTAMKLRGVDDETIAEFKEVTTSSLKPAHKCSKAVRKNAKRR